MKKLTLTKEQFLNINDIFDKEMLSKIYDYYFMWYGNTQVKRIMNVTEYSLWKLKR